ncbi:hypothetical protein NUW58_g2606 [Xylaria curta]|uniref:Uncharacterized protein n=1 Tax=Xylaria curta TaxID=42375 RepID=A0ACC1PES6_9PEZI|nr:hypothetical protein NUW58_g2606 [Xylaria curta]
MNDRGGKPKGESSPHTRRSSSGSSLSFNPEATAFSATSIEGHGYPAGTTGGHGRGGRGRGRGQHGPPLPCIPPKLGRPGHRQQPSMMQGMHPFSTPPSFASVPGYGPVYPMFSTPAPGFSDPSCMSFPPLLPFGFQQQPYYGHQPGVVGQESQNHNFNDAGFTSPFSGATSMSGEPHSRTESESSQGAPMVMNTEQKMESYREEFEAARSFEDDHIYFPNGTPSKRK